MRYIYEVSADHSDKRVQYFNYHILIRQSPRLHQIRMHPLNGTEFSKEKKSAVLFKHIYILCCTLNYMFSAVAENLPFSQKHQHNGIIPTLVLISL